MLALLINLLKQNSIFLVISCLTFPVYLKVSLFFFAIFIIARLLFDNNWDFKHSKYKLRLYWIFKIFFSIAFAIAIAELYFESRIHFYPVSHYDYLLVAIVTLIIKVYPLKRFEIKRFVLVFSISPIVVFLSHLTTIDFQTRNNWGFDNSNALGLYCALCLPLILCQLLICLKDLLTNLKSAKQLQRILIPVLIASYLVCSILLISSGSRSSLYTSLLISLIIFWVHSKSKYNLLLKHSRDRLITKNLFLYIFASLGTVILLYESILTKFVFLRRFINLTNSTNIYRTYVYQCYWELGLAKPWWGWGIDKTSALCEEKLKARYGGVNHAHNFILQLFADSGIIVTLLCLIAIAYFIIIPSFKLICNYNFDYCSTIDLGISTSCLSILIVSLFQSSFYHYPLFPIWLGLLSGSINSQSKIFIVR